MFFGGLSEITSVHVSHELPNLILGLQYCEQSSAGRRSIFCHYQWFNRKGCHCWGWGCHHHCILWQRSDDCRVWTCSGHSSTSTLRCVWAEGEIPCWHCYPHNWSHSGQSRQWTWTLLSDLDVVVDDSGGMSSHLGCWVIPLLSKASKHWCWSTHASLTMMGRLLYQAVQQTHALRLQTHEIPRLE